MWALLQEADGAAGGEGGEGAGGGAGEQLADDFVLQATEPMAEPVAGAAGAEEEGVEEQAAVEEEEEEKQEAAMEGGVVVERARALFDYVPAPPGDLPLTEGQVLLQLLTHQLLTHSRTHLPTG